MEFLAQNMAALGCICPLWSGGDLANTAELLATEGWDAGGGAKWLGCDWRSDGGDVTGQALSVSIVGELFIWKSKIHSASEYSSFRDSTN